MTFPTSLQAACLEAERRIDPNSATVLRNATFLQEVADTTARERETEAFLRRIWNENPLYKLSTGSNSMDIATALTDAAFRRWFRELTDGPFPDDPQEKAAWLDDLMNETKRRIWPNSHGSNVKTTRAFAALFPHDFTTHRSPGRKGGLYEVLSGAKNVKDEARVNRWILDRLDEAIGSVDRTDFNAVARRMMLPEILHQISTEQRQPSEPAPTVSSPDPALSVIWPRLPQIVEHFESLRKDGRLIFDQEVVESLHLGISAREQQHFAVLTGLSGTGKTQLAIEYAKALTGDDGVSNGRICKIAVQPSWYDPTPLLGYVNPLGESRYTATQFLRFLIRAAANPSQPHVCVLDEMNLSHPEQYMAPLLSAMEIDGDEIELHGGEGFDNDIPPRICYPRNLVLIGTVNMDETTMGISDKVLDRAFALEFWDVDVDRWPGWESTSLGDQDRQATVRILTRLMEALSTARLHFGWRVIEEVVRFMEQRQSQSAELSVNDALDRVIYAKVLPKLRGDDSPRFRNALEECRTALNESNLTRSAQKVDELIEDVKQTGSFRFWR